MRCFFTHSFYPCFFLRWLSFALLFDWVYFAFSNDLINHLKYKVIPINKGVKGNKGITK